MKSSSPSENPFRQDLDHRAASPPQHPVHPDLHEQDTDGFEQAQRFLPSPYSYEIRNTDTDYRDELHYASLFSLMQESAYRNAEFLGFGASKLDPLGLCWMLLGISVRLDALPAWGDHLTIETWSRGAQRLLFQRDFEFYRNGDPMMIGAATSDWLVVRSDTHRPQRPDIFSEYQRQVNTRHSLAFRCPKLPALASDLEPALLKYADFSDIDRNRHVNNTRYIAWSIDALYAGDTTETHRIIRGLDINYLAEIRFGTRILVYRTLVDPSMLPDMQPEAIVVDANALLVEGRRAEDQSPVFRALIQYQGRK